VSATIDLVTRAQAGDVDAFGQLYRQYRGHVYSVVLRRVGNTALADDITQDTFVRALRGIAQWQWQGKDVGAWLSTIARNLVIDHHKSAYQRRTMSVGDFADIGMDLRDEGPAANPERMALNGLRNRDLINALRHLTPDQSECLHYRYLREFSVTETAEAMGREEGAIKALTYRAIQALNRFLFRAVTA
jgi:RNA polymerase sigma-70 factor (ECF subfamily)